ncbi:right-handed parallel beta-helix repeat-containing protein [Paenibacillus sp. LHD-117]|uniref:right-handed parallel beta-helix repeat-containing protein n=1 Tax=Paenibacillus sp. LHD-117 TaxID=3071412 RepID=UPI0027E06C1D|nr:right-handed parallel beta-helix repeat-containing protein [Paenibacillus sp. LHD-117]MDQ6421483.1 right-handed parallel beta-helix repeat-containing protein [Paenibacillus sp. LHD-117]
MRRELQTQVNYYVSPHGDDRSQGTESEPFATLDRARRELRSTGAAGVRSATVWLREGTHYAGETFLLTTEDSGTEDAPIRYIAYPGERPVVSGGMRLKAEWEPYRDGIWVCEIPEWRGVPMESLFTELFVNGVRQIRARYPNAVMGEPAYVRPLREPTTWPHAEFTFDPATFTGKDWAHPEEAVVHIFGKNRWGNLQWRVKEVDRQAGLIRLGDGGYQINDIMQGADATGIDQRSDYYIENVFEELDAPGEWYADRDRGLLYYYPPEGLKLGTAIVEVPVLDGIVACRGTQRSPVRHVAFIGLTFRHAAPTYLQAYEAPSLGDWTIHRGGAVFLEGTEHCEIAYCRFDSVGGNAVFMNLYNRGNRVHGCWMHDIGESGVCLVGSKPLTLGSQHAYPAEITVSNNKIHDIGVYGKQTAGVFISVSRDNIVSHNEIFRLPRAAVCINDGTWGGHVIEFNDIYDTVRETGDHGPFNSWGRDRFWCLSQSHGPASHGAGDICLDAREPVVIRNNRFRDRKGWGIDLDDGSSNYVVRENLCIGVSIKLREGDHRTVENNIFVNGANPPGIHIGYEGNSDRFIRNIVVADSEWDNPEVDIDFQKGASKGVLYEFIGPPAQGTWVRELDGNVLFSDVGRFLATVHYRPLGSRTETYEWSDWQSMGWDAHSVFGDPLFIDPEGGDYRVKPDSPALELGFRNFPMDRFGLEDDFPDFG